MAVTLRPFTTTDGTAIVAVWRAAVEATHDFLTHSDIDCLEPQVRNIYLPAVEVWVACGEDEVQLGFIGLSDNKVEMLFVDPASHGCGIGKALIAHARRLKGPLLVDVNEQNPHAHGFYLRQGFRDVGRAATDGQGQPFPLIHMVQS